MTAAVPLDSTDRPDDLVAQVLDLAPARSLALHALAGVSSVEWSDEITTACVECQARPRLLLNRAFVTQHCTTRERLASLLLHELYHITLGHTRLYPRVTALHNLAFDAVINRMLLGALERAHADVTPYAELFTEIYEENASPWFLLRPPPGWPRRPDWDASAGCDRTLRSLHRRLYTVSDAGNSVPGDLPVTYGEIMAALQIASAPADADEPRPGAPGPRGGRLLGAHGATDRERAAISAGRDAQVSEALSDVMAALAKLGQLPGTPSPGRTLDVAGQEDASLVQGVRKLLCTALLKEGDVVAWQTRSRPAQTVSPARDRRAPARRALARAYGAPAPLLFADVTAWRAPEYAAAAVYLDVSGSMAGLVELLHGALLPLRRHLRLSLYAFSNEVVEVSRADFLAGKYRTTWGTDITPVLVHATERAKRVSRVVVLTDGYVGDPTARVLKSFLASKVELHFGVIGDGPLLEGTRWVTSTTRLPTHTRTSSRS